MSNETTTMEPMVNFGGKLEPGTEYVFNLVEIRTIPGVIQYPKQFAKDDKKHDRTYNDLTSEERKTFLLAPTEKMTKKDGTVLDYDKPKLQDVVQLVFQNPDTGIKTGPFDFKYKLYPGKLPADPSEQYVGGFRITNELKAAIQTLTGKDPNTLGGMKSLWDIFGHDLKVVIGVKKELRDEKWTQIDTSSIRRYVEGTTLQKSVDGSNSDELSQKILDAIKSKAMNPMQLLQGIEGYQATDVSNAYKKLKDAGKVKIEGGLVVLA